MSILLLRACRHPVSKAKINAPISIFLWSESPNEKSTLRHFDGQYRVKPFHSNALVLAQTELRRIQKSASVIERCNLSYNLRFI